MGHPIPNAQLIELIYIWKFPKKGVPKHPANHPISDHEKITIQLGDPGSHRRLHRWIRSWMVFLVDPMKTHDLGYPHS
jgi:hypothetical protein